MYFSASRGVQGLSLRASVSPYASGGRSSHSAPFPAGVGGIVSGSQKALHASPRQSLTMETNSEQQQQQQQQARTQMNAAENTFQVPPQQNDHGQAQQQQQPGMYGGGYLAGDGSYQFAVPNPQDETAPADADMDEDDVEEIQYVGTSFFQNKNIL